MKNSNKKKMTGEKRLKKRYILMTVLVFLLLSVSVLIHSVFDILPPGNFTALVEGAMNKDLPDFFTSWAAGTIPERDYSTLPEIMVMNDGTTVETPEQYEERKDEVIKLFKETVYGEVPDIPYQTTFTVLEESDDAVNGKAIRKQIEMTVKTAYGESKALMLMYLPKSDQPVPVFIGLNFKGNHTAYSDPAIIPSFATTKTPEEIKDERGVRYGRWPVEEIIDNNYGIVTIYCDDFAPDNGDNYNSRLISIFSDPEAVDQPDFKAISAWAFGLMRGIDYLETDALVDMNRLISVGHSRLGKTSLWAGAQDERINLVIANGSGNSGASLSRSARGETVASINVFFPYWFVDGYEAYGNNEEALPLDQHMLLASIAPRKLYVSSATEDYWADPEGEFTSLSLASEGFEIYGIEPFDPAEMPPAGSSIHGENLAYHIRDGIHNITPEDWQYFMLYADQNL